MVYAGVSDTLGEEDDVRYFERRSQNYRNLYDPESGFYSLVEVPGDLDGALDHLLSEYGFSWPLADLAYSDPFVTMIEGVELGSYVGLHTVGDTPCHHLAFRQEV